MPRGSRLSPLYNSAYFIDSFAVTLPPQRCEEYKPAALARALFTEPPTWFSILMWIRDRVMSVFGIKGSTEIRAVAEKKGVDTIFIFPVISSTQAEIILGENDKHLDFRTSILIRDRELGREDDRGGDGSGQEMVVTTVVHCHGLLGKAYITIIKPFHVLITKYSLARVPEKIMTKDY